MLRLSGISKAFGGLQALDGVNLEVREGRIHSLIGPNGAGKTTLFNIITGTLSPDSGRIEFFQEDTTGKKPHEICQRGIARTFQQTNLFSSLTVLENVRAGTLKDGMEEDERMSKVSEILSFLGLEDKAKNKVSDLTPLDTSLTELGRALATDPKLLLLDELYAGLSSEEANKVSDSVETLRGRGITVFQAGHSMGPIMDMSDKIFVLHKGSLIAEGSPEEIQGNEEVKRVYLGTGT